MIKRALGLAVVLMVLGLVACQTSEPGAKNTFGTITDDTVGGSPLAVVDAAKAVAEELKLVLVSAEGTGVDGKVVMRTANDRDITMTVYRQAENVSQVNIRVGWTGDEGMALTILRKIKEKVGDAPAEEPAADTAEEAADDAGGGE